MTILPAALTASAPVRPPRRRKRLRHTTIVIALPFIAPALAAYLIFALGPMVESIRLSLFSWSGISGAPQEFVGLQNYVRIFTQDPVFWQAFGNSLLWVILSLLIPVTLGLVLALALNRPLFARNTFRAVIYIPGVLAAIAVANMWRWIYNPNFGVAKSLGDTLGLPWLSEIQWLGDGRIALFSIFVASVWSSAGGSDGALPRRTAVRQPGPYRCRPDRRRQFLAGLPQRHPARPAAQLSSSCWC